MNVTSNQTDTGSEVEETSQWRKATFFTIIMLAAILGGLPVGTALGSMLLPEGEALVRIEFQHTTPEPGFDRW